MHLRHLKVEQKFERTEAERFLRKRLSGSDAGIGRPLPGRRPITPQRY